MRISADILAQVIQIGFGESVDPKDDANGSAFLVRQAGRGFLVTAAHVLAPAYRDGRPPAVVRIWGAAPEPINVALRSVRHRGEDKIDVALLELAEPLPFALEPVSLEPLTTIELGDDTLILGFSGARVPGAAPRAGDGRLVPLVRRGIVSALRSLGDGVVVLLDAGSNPGLSGGLVLVADAAGTFRPIAMNAGCVIERTPVLAEQVETSLFVRGNAGLAYAFSLDLIASVLTSMPRAAGSDAR